MAMPPVSNADLTAAHKALLRNYFIFAMTGLVCYEHLLTFKYEIDFLRRRRKSAATWIFVFNRYFLLAKVLFWVAPAHPQTFVASICTPLYMLKPRFSCNNPQAADFLSFLATTLPTLPIHAFAILRTLALSHHRPWRSTITCILTALAFVVFVADAYRDFNQIWIYGNDPVLGPSCFDVSSFVSANTINSNAVDIGAAAIVLVVTLMTTALPVQSPLRLGITLSKVLLRDGSVFFLLILFVDIVGALPSTDESPLVTRIRLVVIPLFTVLPLFLLSRFIINLRQIDSPITIPSDVHRFSLFSGPSLRIPTMDDIVDNLGEPLDLEGYRLDDGVGDGIAQTNVLGAVDDQHNAVDRHWATANGTEATGSTGDHRHVAQ